MKKIQDTRSIVHRTMMPQSPQSRYLGTSHSSPITISCPIIFSWISLTDWNLLPFKGDYSFGKSQKPQGPNLGCRVSWVISCFAKKLCMRWMWYTWAGYIVMMKPITIAQSWIIQVVSVEECAGLMQNLMQIHCSTRSVILNVMVTHANSVMSSAPLD